MKSKVLFSLLVALLLAVAGQSQTVLLKLKQTNGDSIGLNRDAIWKAVSTSSGTTVTVGTKAYYLTTPYADFLELGGGEFKTYTYFVGASTKTFALNRNAIMRAYKSGSNSTILLSNGTQYSLDDTFHSLFGTTTVAYTDFASADTIGYRIPAGAKALQIVCVGGGGGGGSGRRGAAFSPRSGGGGGGGGAISEATFLVSDLTLDTLIVMIGNGGAGGDTVEVNDTNGNIGVAGVESKVLHGSTTLIKASGGSPGAAGVAVPVSGGAGGTVGDFVGSAGGASDTTAVGTVGVSATTKTSGGGGGGGALGHASTARAGGAGGAGFYGLQSGGAANTAATALASARYIGGGGGGGTSHASNAGGQGGAGVAGGGGGGGAASTNGADSGAGGRGGDGYVRIIPIF